MGPYLQTGESTITPGHPAYVHVRVIYRHGEDAQRRAADVRIIVGVVRLAADPSREDWNRLALSYINIIFRTENRSE